MRTNEAWFELGADKSPKNGPEDADYALLVEGVFKGIGQIWFCDGLGGSLLIIFGMFLCSPILTLAALYGSLLGQILGFLNGAPYAALYEGLYSYNSALGCSAIIGMFYVLSARSFFFGTVCGVFCCLLTPALATSMRASGLPVFTFPFCFGVIPFVLVQGSLRKIIPVSLATMTVPEDHLRRLQMTARVVDSFRNAINGAGKSSDEYTKRCERELSFAGGQLDKTKIKRVFKTILTCGKASSSAGEKKGVTGNFSGTSNGKLRAGNTDSFDSGTTRDSSAIKTVGVADGQHHPQNQLTPEILYAALQQAGYSSISEIDCREMLKTMDVDNSGAASCDEFYHFLSMRYALAIKKRELGDYFRLIDATGRGEISFRMMNDLSQDLGLEALTDEEIKGICCAVRTSSR